MRTYGSDTRSSMQTILLGQCSVAHRVNVNGTRFESLQLNAGMLTVLLCTHMHATISVLVVLRICTLAIRSGPMQLARTSAEGKPVFCMFMVSTMFPFPA